MQDDETPGRPSSSQDLDFSFLTASQLFEELDVVYDQLLQNADRWFVSGGGDEARRALDERRELKQRGEDVETELRARVSWNAWPIPNFRCHGDGRSRSLN